METSPKDTNESKFVIDFLLRDIKGETNPDKVIYCVRFCEKYESLWSYFAAVGSNVVSIYSIEESDVVLVRHFIDEGLRSIDENGELNRENFYACTWASSGIDLPVVVAGGKNGIIKVISTEEESTVGVIHGHGGDIHELKSHPKNDELIFSASKDLSVRLWNVKSLVCVAIFGGEQGHRQDVLSLDVHALGNCMVSSSLDTSIKIWNLRSPQLLDAIRKSDEPQPDSKSFPTHLEQIPLFSTTQIHAGYVDSVKWVGDCILSKSTNNRVVLWMPDPYRYKGASLILQEYTLQQANVWFIKLDICIPLGIFAVGNTKGKVSVFPLGPDIPEKLLYPAKMEGGTTERYQFDRSCHPLNGGLQNPKLTTPVRHVSFSSDAKYLVACLDEGFIMTWDVSLRPFHSTRSSSSQGLSRMSGGEDGDNSSADEFFVCEED